jgi:hypothetical protein
VEQHMLTTIDNPYDPFTQYNEWSAFDEEHGYYTPQLLARIAISSEELSEKDQDLAIESAIDEIVEFNVSGMHKKVPAPVGWNS